MNNDIVDNIHRLSKAGKRGTENAVDSRGGDTKTCRDMNLHG